MTTTVCPASSAPAEPEEISLYDAIGGRDHARRRRVGSPRRRLSAPTRRPAHQA